MIVVFKNEEFLGIPVSGNNVSKEVWVRIVQARSSADQHDKTAVGSSWSQPCCSWLGTTWSRRILGKKVF